MCVSDGRPQKLPARDFKLRNMQPHDIPIFLYTCRRHWLFADSHSPTVQEQEGAECSEARNFVQKAKGAFRKIRAMCPGLNMKYRKGGLVLEPLCTGVPALVAGGRALRAGTA